MTPKILPAALLTLFAVASLDPSSSALAYGWARQAGWEEMCLRKDQPLNFCAPASGPEVVEDSQPLRNLLAAVNDAANAAYAYRSDRSMYGVADHWTVPPGNAADCEDFVLLKMLHLHKQGVPRSAMSIVAGNLSNGRWHSVLLVHTSSGSLMLDNLRTGVSEFDPSRFSNTYIMSMQDTNRWWPLN